MASEAAFSSSQAPNGLKLRADQHVGRPSGASVAAFYELQRIADAVLLHGARHVAPQFPEAFLADAADVVWQLEGIFEAAGRRRTMTARGASTAAMATVAAVMAAPRTRCRCCSCSETRRTARRRWMRWQPGTCPRTSSSISGPRRSARAAAAALGEQVAFCPARLRAAPLRRSRLRRGDSQGHPGGGR